MQYRSNIIQIEPLDGGYYRLGIVCSVNKLEYSKIIKMLNKDFEVDIELTAVGDENLQE